MWPLERRRARTFASAVGRAEPSLWRLTVGGDNWAAGQLSRWGKELHWVAWRLVWQRGSASGSARVAVREWQYASWRQLCFQLGLKFQWKLVICSRANGAHSKGELVLGNSGKCLGSAHTVTQGCRRRAKFAERTWLLRAPLPMRAHTLARMDQPQRSTATVWPGPQSSGLRGRTNQQISICSRAICAPTYCSPGAPHACAPATDCSRLRPAHWSRGLSIERVGSGPEATRSQGAPTGASETNLGPIGPNGR